MIAVGGLSLSRGLTLEGLCTSYYYRNSSMYDTLMQMGRWFGYRDKYKDVCKVWMPALSMAYYAYISMATDELRAEVRRMQDEDMTPRDFGLAVRSDIKGLLVTATNKMRSAKDYETTINFSGKVVETRYLHSSKDVLDRNLEATASFLDVVQSEYSLHRDDPDLEIRHPQFLSVRKDLIVDYLKSFSVHTMNSDFIIHDLVNLFSEDTESIFDRWDILIAQGRENSPISFAGVKGIVPVKRGFAYRKDTKSLQMSGKNSRLGSKDLAKGGLSHKTVVKMEATGENNGKAFSEDFYFNTGIDRNPLLVIYPVLLSEGDVKDAVKHAITTRINYPVVGLSIGIPRISGKKEQRIKYKINKQKWLEIFGADSEDDFEEIDETIQEE